MKTPPPKNLSKDFAAALKSDWRSLARPEQLPPKDFSVWLFLAGRGSGKNWADSHYVHEQAATGAAKRIALIGATADAARFVMVEGQSGILAAAGAWERPIFEAGKGQLTWPSGTIARLYSADSPELLRGPEHDLAWCDELASWRRAQETWDNLMMGMRLGKHPRIVISTTPKPSPLIKDLVKRAAEGKDGIVITRSSTYDNRANLPPSFFAQMVKKYEGTRVGRQELNAELLLDTPGSLWTSENLEATRVTQAPAMQRIVVAIDPSGSGSEDADECGIIVAGLGQDGEGYVLADLSARMTPTEWARRAIDAYRHFKADRIIAETNFGSLMVIGTIEAIDPNVPTKAITSSRGKVLRAEPISTLFEQGRCHLVGSFPELEDQATSFTSDYDRSRDGSPDRVDALVFAFTELMCNQPAGGYFSPGLLLVNGEPVATYPNRMGCVLAVAATPNKSGDRLGVVYLAVDEHKATPWPLVILGYDLRPVDESLFEGYLHELYGRLANFARICGGCDNRGLWVHGKAGVCAALLRRAAELNLLVSDIDEQVNWGASPLADRAAAAAIHLHTGRRVKISCEAHAELVDYRGFKRNHLLAQYAAFKIDEELESDELLRALLSGVLITLTDSRAAAVDDVEIFSPPPAPLAALLPPPHVLLKPGQHKIDGAIVTVPADGDKDLVAWPLEPGRHLVDDKITYVTRPGVGGFRVF